jgi:hypothetical protein
MKKWNLMFINIGKLEALSHSILNPCIIPQQQKYEV